MVEGSRRARALGFAAHPYRSIALAGFLLCSTKATRYMSGPFLAWFAFYIAGLSLLHALASVNICVSLAINKVNKYIMGAIIR